MSSVSPTHQDLSNDTTFSQIKFRVPVPLRNLADFCPFVSASMKRDVLLYTSVSTKNSSTCVDKSKCPVHNLSSLLPIVRCHHSSFSSIVLCPPLSFFLFLVLSPPSSLFLYFLCLPSSLLSCTVP